MGFAKTLDGNQCVVHGYHYPTPLRTVVHHVWPKEYGGPDIESNKVKVCDTGHYNIHELLWQLMHGRPMKGGTRKERALAQKGYDQWVAAKKASGEFHG